MLQSALTVDIIDGCGMAGQAQDGTVAAVDVVQDVATQGDVAVEGKERDDAQQGDNPGKGTANVQPSRRHDG